MTPSEILTQLNTHGYVIIPSLISSDLLPILRAAAERTTAVARDPGPNGWPHVRIVGKQFPPWPPNMPRTDVWGVSHILHPSLTDHNLYASWYASDAITSTVATILECQQNELCMELFGLLINPLTTPFQLSWHRDAIPHTASESEEARVLGIVDGVWKGDDDDGGEDRNNNNNNNRRETTQWNTALYADTCLEVVPGSHRRVRTEQERTCDPMSEKYMPGAIKVELKEGETVFYDNNILHRGVYGTEVRRATLHASMGRRVEGETARARRTNVLQHGLGWVRGVEWVGVARMGELRERLLEMVPARGEEEEEEEEEGKGVGYSLEG